MKMAMTAATTQSTTRQNGATTWYLQRIDDDAAKRSLPVAEQPNHEEPRGSGDGSGGEHHEDARDRTLDGNNGPSTVGHGEADVDGRDHGQSERVDGRRIEPPETERRGRLKAADNNPPQHRAAQ